MVELADGKIVEVEGGWTSLPRDWEHMSFLEQEFSLVNTTALWMDKPVNIKKLRGFHLAG
jgi:hypothetical protein